MPRAKKSAPSLQRFEPPAPMANLSMPAPAPAAPAAASAASDAAMMAMMQAQMQAQLAAARPQPMAQPRAQPQQSQAGGGVISIPPFHYVHVLDLNANVTRVLTGPSRYTRQDHERVLFAEPQPMISIPPRCYVVVSNPAVRDAEGQPEVDRFGQIRLRHGDVEIRLADDWADPFPLLPGEAQTGQVMQLQVVERNCALRLRASRSFGEHEAGDEWLFVGPGTYIPRVEVELVDRLVATLVREGQAVRLRARRTTTDSSGGARQAGEEWLVRTPGEYLPRIDEEVVGVVSASVLTEQTALRLTALRGFVDVYGEERKAGEHWLVTSTMTDAHIADVYERVVGTVSVTTLSNRQYCVVVDPFVDGVQRLGGQELRQGEVSFFLKPGESMPDGIQDVYVLADDEALLLQAREAHSSPGGDVRQPGDRWMVYGPCDYIPPVEVQVLDSIKAMPLDENEGVYVRDNKTGQVRAVIGETYMLSATEELWEKDLPEEVEELLQRQAMASTYIVPAHFGGQQPPCDTGARDKTRVVKFQVPHNSAVQVYDYRQKSSRVVFGPDLVLLMPDEQFSVLRLSGDKPKRPNVIASLCLMMGPDFMTDIVTVETSDHARLQLTLSYNWHFEVDEADPANMFNVRDFTGDACKAIASRVRGAVACETFDNFHKHSARIIRGSVFTISEADGRVGDCLRFEANGLVITNVDIQSVEPVDQATRQSLQKSVQMAIEITTDSQEARAKHDARCEEEAAGGRLERQRLENEADAEAARRQLLELRAESAAVETSGQAKAEARARAEAAEIQGEGAVKQARLRAEAAQIEASAALEMQEARRRAEVEHQQRMNELEVAKARQMAEIEASQFGSMVTAIGADTITAIARAGPELQAELLKGLGLQGYMVTDGKSPINLMSTAQGMIGPMGGAAAPSSG